MAPTNEGQQKPADRRNEAHKGIMVSKEGGIPPEHIRRLRLSGRNKFGELLDDKKRIQR